MLRSLALAALCATSLGVANARDGWQGRPLVCDPAELGADMQACRSWIEDARKPDGPAERNRRGRCCGESDAYIADSFRTREDGKFVAIITKDYPAYNVDDGEGGTAALDAVPKGTEIEIPDDKINSAQEDGGNPTGHGIIFMSASRYVYCYFGPTLALAPISRGNVQ